MILISVMLFFFLILAQYFEKFSTIFCSSISSKTWTGLEFKLNEKELFIKNYLANTSDKNTQLSIRKFRLFERLTKSKLKFNLTKKIIYSLSIFGLAFILGSTLFFISQSKKDESNITNKTIELEKGF